jgi:AAA+ superfamily predicted ATPase
MSKNKKQPHEFEGALVQFFEKVAAWGHIPDDEPEIRRLLSQHFGQDPSVLTIVSESFPEAEHPNLHLSIEEYISNSSRSFELVGVVSERMSYSRLSFAQLVGGLDGESVSRGPVQYVNLRTGPAEVLPCVDLGLYLVREGESRLAIFLVGPNDMSYSSSLRVEVMAQRNEAAHKLIADLRRSMRERTIYRGRVLSLSVNQRNALDVNFHTLPEIGTDDIILPKGLLDRIERQTVRFTANAEKLKAAGRHLKRGLLLHGSPGTGKTLTAMYLASRMPDRTVLLLTGSGIGLLGYACHMARALQPSTIVLEDVDLIAEERTREGKCGALLFELLNEMDGLSSDADVLFLLTTNRPDILEPALAARPGRIDLAIEVPLPDADCRRRLFELYSRGLQMRVTDLDGFIHRTEGGSGAFVRELLRKAALIAADQGAGEIVVEDRHIDEALRELVVDGGQLTRSLLGASMSDGNGNRPRG